MGFSMGALIPIFISNSARVHKIVNTVIANMVTQESQHGANQPIQQHQTVMQQSSHDEHDTQHYYSIKDDLQSDYSDDED